MTARWLAWCERHFRLVLGITFAGMLALAWRNRFLQDDAFIVFRYADHLVRGHGLVFNPGERVEGYTCFLYVLLVALGMRLGLEPGTASFAIGLAAFAGSLVATYRLAARLSGSRMAGLVTMIVLGTNYTFSAYATGGLETQLQAFLAVAFLDAASASLAPTPARATRLLACSAIAGLAVLTRPDSPLLLASLGAALLLDTLRAAPDAKTRTLNVLALLAPAVLLVGGWIVWKLAYYGELLPNTFYVKAATPGSPMRGLVYVYRFVTTYWFEAVLVFAAWRWREALIAGGRVPLLLIATLAIWTAYVVALGGDFMEFRLFVPVLPIVAWLVVRTASALERPARLGGALIALVLVGSLQHAIVFNRSSHPEGIESVWHLQSHLLVEEHNWIGIGRVLGREFGGSDVAIATTAAGAIPFYSGLRCVDMLGLNDREISRRGLLRRATPGHRRLASLDYLMERKVNLVLGHPALVHWPTAGPFYIEDHPVPTWLAGEARGQKVLPGLQVLEIPIEHGYRLYALYLEPHPLVDEAIRRHGWRRRDVASRGEVRG